jgi:hypothetical protein
MNKSKLNIIGMIVFFLIIIALIARDVLEKKSLNQESRFTIGVITKIEPNMRSGYRIYFNYYVLDKKYEAFGGIYKWDNDLIGKRFYIRFSPSNPDNCELLLEKPVRSDVKNAPPEGWERIPE